MKYRLSWKDGVKATDARVKTVNGKHSYEFETEDDQAAKAVVVTFMRIQPNHNFERFDLINVKTGERVR